MKLTSILGWVTGILSATLYFVIPAYRKKINRLQSEVAEREAELELVQENEKIKSEVDSLGLDELSNGLRKSKTSS